MADIVDDVENIERFMAAMNNFASTFTQGKNYGTSSKSTLKSSASSAVLSPALVPIVMDPTDENKPGSPPALSSLEPSQVPERHPQETLLTWEIVPQGKGSPVTPPRSVPNGVQLHHSGEWSDENSPPDGLQTKNSQSLKVESVVNKNLLSPQLIGRIAPPPTPETTAHDSPTNGHNIEELLRYHVGQRLESKAEPVGLGESIYATHRSSHLTRIPPAARPKFGTIDGHAISRFVTPTSQMSNEERRERDLSYERLSFSIANSIPVLAPSANKMPSSGKGFNEGPRVASRAVGESEATAYIPPHLRAKADSPNARNGTMSEPKTQDQKEIQASSQGGTSPTPVVKGIQAGLAALRAKYVRSSSSQKTAEGEHTEQQIPDSSGEQVFHNRGVSSTLSNDSHKPAHLKLGPQTLGITTIPTPPLTSDVATASISNNPSRPGAADAIKSGTYTVTDQARVTATTTSNLITPSSANFAMISPSTGRHVEASATNSAANRAEEGNPIFFGRWPRPKSREELGTGRAPPKSPEGNTTNSGSFSEPKTAARVRKAVLSKLPSEFTAKSVASLVYGGQLESIIMKPNSRAEVLFINADHCLKFCDDTRDGLFSGKGKIKVNPHSGVDVIGGKLSQMIDSGVTRCVCVIPGNLGCSIEDLCKLAQDKKRKVESIDDSVSPEGHRNITFRFCKMEDANSFKGALSRDPEWEHCNVVFATDPCASATGPRLETKP